MQGRKTAGQQKRDEILEVIVKYMLENGFSPTIRDIGEAVGLKSTASVYNHLEKLKNEGRLSFRNNEPRTITVPGVMYSDFRNITNS